MAMTAQAGEIDYTIPGGGDFHPPHSAAEAKLDKILKWDGNVDSHDDSNMMYYLLDIPHRNINKDKKYINLFTDGLRSAASKAEAEAVKETCGGIYTGDLCGLGFDPIICAQDTPNYYLYRVEQQSRDRAIITVGFARSINDKDPYPSGTYTMVKRGKRWVLDGILCQNWSGYNFTDFDAVNGLTSKSRQQ